MTYLRIAYYINKYTEYTFILVSEYLIMSEITSIKLTKNTKKKLAKRGEKGDTFEQILSKLLDEK